MAPLRKAVGSLTKMYGPFKKGGVWHGEGCFPFKRRCGSTSQKMHCPFKGRGCDIGRGVAPLKETVGSPHKKCVAPLREGVRHGEDRKLACLKRALTGSERC